MMKSERDIKRNVILIRLSDSDEDKLEYLAEKTGKNKSEIMRDALRAEYNLSKFLD